MPHPNFLKQRPQLQNPYQNQMRYTGLMQTAPSPVYKPPTASPAGYQPPPSMPQQKVQPVAQQPDPTPQAVPKQKDQGAWGKPITDQGKATSSRANLTGNQLPTWRQKMWGRAGADVTNGNPAPKAPLMTASTPNPAAANGFQ